MVASVPELTSRTWSTGGTLATISSASSTSPGDGVPNDVPRPAASRIAATMSGCAWPRIIGPQEQTRSTYSWPSASVRYGPRPDTMNLGVPPTARKARTGEFTPPGVTALARANSASDAGASLAEVMPSSCRQQQAAADLGQRLQVGWLSWKLASYTTRFEGPAVRVAPAPVSGAT